MLYVRGNNGDTDDAEYYVNHLVFAVLPELDGGILYTSLYYRSKPHHDGCVMTGCDADGTVSEHSLKKNNRLDSSEGLYFLCDYSFWASKLFRTSGFLVLNVQLFPYFHHGKRHLKKRTVGFDPLPPAYAVYAHENDDNYGRPLTGKTISYKSKHFTQFSYQQELVPMQFITGKASGR